MALDVLPLLGETTGVGQFADGLAHALALRAQVELLAYAVTWRRRNEIKPLLPDGVPLASRPIPARPVTAFWARGARLPVELFIGKVDVVHGVNFVVPPTRRAASIVSVHDLTPLRYPELCDPRTLAYPQLIRTALRRGAWVHADSAFVAREIVDAFGVKTDRMRVVYPAAPTLPEVDAATARTAVSRHVPHDAPYVLGIGTAEPRKDLPGLVRAFGQFAARHSDVWLVLVGPAGWGEGAVADSVAASPMRERIVRTGWVPPVELSALLAGAQVLAYPSLYEGFGFPPLQAMRAGVPVVATRAGSIPEVVGDAAVLVEPGDVDALADALSEVMRDDELRSRLVSAGRARAALFEWDACAAGFEQLYRDAAGDRGD